MKSFLLKGKKPIIKWGSLPDNVFFEGTVPEGYSLAVSPGENEKYVIVDVDRHGDLDGFKNVPREIQRELYESMNYPTKNSGSHFWVKYSGNKPLANKASGLGIDLRTDKGYVVWYPTFEIRENLHFIKETSTHLNAWLELLFSYK